MQLTRPILKPVQNSVWDHISIKSKPNHFVQKLVEKDKDGNEVVLAERRKKVFAMNEDQDGFRINEKEMPEDMEKAVHESAEMIGAMPFMGFSAKA